MRQAHLRAPAARLPLQPARGSVLLVEAFGPQDGRHLASGLSVVDTRFAGCAMRELGPFAGSSD